MTDVETIIGYVERARVLADGARSGDNVISVDFIHRRRLPSDDRRPAREDPLRGAGDPGSPHLPPEDHRPLQQASFRFE